MVYFVKVLIYNTNQDLLTLIGKCLDEGSTPSTSTKNTLADVRIKTVSGTIRSQCVFDGGVMGSTGAKGFVENRQSRRKH